MTDLKLPVYEVIRKPKLPLLVGFRFENPEYGPVIDHMERGRKWGGVAWMVTIAKPHRPRTTGKHSGNAHFNGHVQQISMETGNDFEDVKLYVKRMALKRGLRIQVNEHGGPVYSMNTGEAMPISEADMSTEECSWCIEECHILAGGLGIRLIEEEQ